MKIVHISTYPPKAQKHSAKSGVASYLKNLLGNSPYGPGDKIYVLCDKLDAGGQAYEEDGLAIRRCFDRNIGYIAQLNRQIKDIRPDVIHVQQELALFGGILTALALQLFMFRWRKLGTVITLHGVVSLRQISGDFVKENNSKMPAPFVKLAFYVIYKPLTIWAKKVVVHEEQFKATLCNEYSVPASKISVIHHGVEEFEAIQPDTARKQISLPIDKQAVLFMGYAAGYKGIDMLIREFAKYAKKAADAYLIIGAGMHPKLKADADYLKKYESWKNLAADLIPEDQYRWVGFIDEKDIVNYYCGTDVSVYPYTTSMSSSGPMSIAIGYEKAFLASDVFREVLKDEMILFGREPGSLAAKLEYFFEHGDQYRRIARRLKRDRLWPQIGRQTYGQYIEVVQ